MELENLQDLYVSQLKDAMSAEKQIVKALPRMIRAAENTELVRALEEHLEVTNRQVERLEAIFSRLDASSGGQKCKGMEGLLKEGAEALTESKNADTLDAAVILAAQKVEHYEIALYGGLRTYAELLGDRAAVTLLDQSLAEEKEADETLTRIAMSAVNLEAVDADEAPVAKGTTRANGRRRVASGRR